MVTESKMIDKSLLLKISNYFSLHYQIQLYMELFTFSEDSDENKRMMIRQGLLRHLKSKIDTAQHFKIENKLLNLNERPQKLIIEDNVFYNSISHTQNQGIFVTSNSPIGIDLEITTRITRKLIERISTFQEIALTPDLEVLWSIKEASFKALPMAQQTKTISSIEIQSLQDISSDFLLNSDLHSNSDLAFTPKAVRFMGGIKTQDEMSLSGIAVKLEFTQLALATILKHR